MLQEQQQQQQPVPTAQPVSTAQAVQSDKAFQPRTVDFQMSRYFSQGWHYFWRNACQMIFILLLDVIMGVIALVLISTLVTDLTNGGRVIGLACQLIFNAFVTIPLEAGSYLAVFEAMRERRSVHASDVFRAFTDCGFYARLVWFGFLWECANIILWALFIIPGIWWDIATLLALPMFVDFRNERMGAGAAMCNSIQVVHSHCLWFFLFVCAIVVFNFLGALFFGIGLLITIPVSFLAVVFCYEHLVGIRGVDAADVVAPGQQNYADQQYVKGNYAGNYAGSQAGPQVVVHGGDSVPVAQPVN